MANLVVIPLNAAFAAEFERVAKQISAIEGKTYTAQDMAELALNMGFDLLEGKTRAHMQRSTRLQAVGAVRGVH